MEELKTDILNERKKKWDHQKIKPTMILVSLRYTI